MSRRSLQRRAPPRGVPLKIVTRRRRPNRAADALLRRSRRPGGPDATRAARARRPAAARRSSSRRQRASATVVVDRRTAHRAQRVAAEDPADVPDEVREPPEVMRSRPGARAGRRWPTVSRAMTSGSDPVGDGILPAAASARRCRCVLVDGREAAPVSSRNGRGGAPCTDTGTMSAFCASHTSGMTSRAPGVAAGRRSGTS